MKKILLPTDFSENAHNAAKYAMDFFGHQETRYYLYHVHDLNTLQDIVFDDIGNVYYGSKGSGIGKAGY